MERGGEIVIDEIRGRQLQIVALAKEWYRHNGLSLDATDMLADAVRGLIEAEGRLNDSKREN